MAAEGKRHVKDASCAWKYIPRLTAYTEGPWDDVMRVIGQCHVALHQNGVVRIQSDIRVGSRTDKKQTSKDKVAAVEKLLKEESS